MRTSMAARRSPRARHSRATLSASVSTVVGLSDAAAASPTVDSPAFPLLIAATLGAAASDFNRPAHRHLLASVDMAIIGRFGVVLCPRWSPGPSEMVEVSNARRRSQWYQPRNALVATGAIAMSALFGVDGEARSACETAFEEGDWTRAAAECEALYADSGLADDGILVAQARMYLDDIGGATAVARRLLATREAGIAHRVLSWAARQRQELPIAVVHATAAMALHIASSDDFELARDAHALATTTKLAGA